jgi:hypothetical protein
VAAVVANAVFRKPRLVFFIMPFQKIEDKKKARTQVSLRLRAFLAGVV